MKEKKMKDKKRVNNTRNFIFLNNEVNKMEDS